MVSMSVNCNIDVIAVDLYLISFDRLHRGQTYGPAGRHVVARAVPGALDGRASVHAAVVHREIRVRAAVRDRVDLAVRIREADLRHVFQLYTQRAAFRQLIELGYLDVLRFHQPMRSAIAARSSLTTCGIGSRSRTSPKKPNTTSRSASRREIPRDMM